MDIEIYSKANSIKCKISSLEKDLINLTMIKECEREVVCSIDGGYPSIDFKNVNLVNAIYKMEIEYKAKVEKLKKEFEGL